MSAFEYVFGFYSLILGLAAAEVVTGFADMWRDRRKIAVGISTPLVALCVLMGVMNAWVTFWARRETLEVTAEAMLLSVLMALPYVFTARIMFPREGQATSLEDHFFEHRRMILLGITAPPLVGRIYQLLEGGGWPLGFAGVYFAARIALPLGLLVFRGRRLNQVGLALLALILVTGLFR